MSGVRFKGGLSKDSASFRHKPSLSDPSTQTACPYFLRGSCQYGSQCRKSHIATAPQAVQLQTNPGNSWRQKATDNPPAGKAPSMAGYSPTFGPSANQNSIPAECKYYSQGNCTKGDSCTFRHTASSAVVPIKATAFGECKFHARGVCVNGDSCPFRHGHK